MRDNVALGYYIMLYCDINGINLSEIPYYWILSGNTSSGTTISDNGRLCVAPDETATELTVTVVSNDDANYTSTLTIPVLEEYPLITGDVNRDGYIDIIDATAIQRHLAGLELIPAKNLAAADTDGDGEITVADVRAMSVTEHMCFFFSRKACCLPTLYI